jgi:hypothetical protein
MINRKPSAASWIKEESWIMKKEMQTEIMK